MTETKNTNRPNMRVFQILEVLGQANGPMTASEIHRTLQLPKQTIHRLCNAMEEEGILVREGGGRSLRPARRAREMASTILSSAHAPIARHQILARVAKVTGETVNLVVAHKEGMFYIDRVETGWPMRLQLPIGTHVPFHCTASGKVFLSSLEPGKRTSLIKSLELEALTTNTITGPEALEQEIKRVEKQGHAIDNGEFIDQLIAIAVPIRSAKRRFLAAIALHGPALRFSPKDALAKRGLLMEAAAQLRDVV